MKTYLVILLTLLISACGGSSSTSDNDVVGPPVTGVEQAKFSLGIAMHPLTMLSRWCLKLTLLKL